jgi:hypothetical protein
VIDSTSNLARSLYRAFRFRFTEASEWKSRRYAAPSPVRVKREVLMRNSTPQATWVETGTYLGETTKYLAPSAKQVFSLEPEPALFRRAQQRFANTANVTIINAASEVSFPTLLPTLSGAVNFWLDGHYSAGITFRGNKDTPIIEELAQIEANLQHMGPVSVMIDDIRCFDPTQEENAGYPAIDFLVDWARRNRFKWHIEHDIFVARSM